MTAPQRGIGALREFFYGEDIGQAAIEPVGPITVGRMGKWRVTYEGWPAWNQPRRGSSIHAP